MTHVLLRIVLASFFLAQLVGCIQLTGQRLAWHHDAEADTFTAVLFYDGIHDKSDTPREIENSRKRFGEFVDAGNIMLIDWYGELKLGEIRDMPQERLDRKPEIKAIRPFIKNIRTEPIGHYVESDQIGAAQYVQISNVSTFLKGVNAFIDFLQVAESEPDTNDPADVRRTYDMRVKLAKQGYEWIVLDGQAIIVSIPFDPQHWARVKAEALSNVISGFLRASPEPTQPRDRNRWHAARMMVQLMAAMPVSVDDCGEIVKFRFGHRDETNIARARIRDGYNDVHAETVVDHIPDSLHEKIVTALVAGKGGKPVDAVIRFGPPEVAMLALAEAGKAGNESAIKALRERARAWNKAGRVPEISNVESELPINLINGVYDWHRAMKRYPMKQDQLELPAEHEPATR